MKFKREVAMVLNEKLIPLTVVLGNSASVIFPDKFIWNLHYTRPGYVQYFAHTHPPGIPEMSEEDRTTLKAWSYALYPHKLGFFVVSDIKISWGNNYIMEYWYELETLEEWVARGRKGERKVELHQVKWNISNLGSLGWLEVLLELSYEKEK